jgi:AcrR family transcriptional regulator
MDDVARAARVAHGTAFVHFKTRDQFLAAVIKEYADRTALRIKALADEDASVREVLQAHLRGLSEMEAFYARLATEGASLSPPARSALLGIQSAVSTHLAEAMQREMHAGLVRPLPADLVFNTWIGLVNHYVVNRDLFAPGASVLERRGGMLIEYFLALLKP